jgi:hypothetical protein
MLKIVTDDAERDDLATSLDELVAEGPLRMLMARRLLINSVLAFVFALCETARYARYEQSES